MITITHGDNLNGLRELEDQSVDMIYMDPPFNTGKLQVRDRIKVIRDNRGNRTGFQGKKYKTQLVGTASFFDDYGNNYIEFLAPRLEQCYRVLKNHGSLFVHLDCREVHYVKVFLDHHFGRECFKNEIIWSFDYGGKSTTKWSVKHNNILWYCIDPEDYIFKVNEVDRIPYMSPQLVTKEKAERGKRVTDSWWMSIVGTNSHERNGFPTQKPEKLLERLVKVHSNPKSVLLDPFAGSGTLGAVAHRLGRSCILMDSHHEAFDTMKKRLASAKPIIRYV